MKYEAAKTAWELYLDTWERSQLETVIADLGYLTWRYNKQEQDYAYNLSGPLQ